MRRPALLAMLALGAALLAAGCAGGGTDEPAVPQGRFLASNRSLTPGTHLFGDSVRARVELVVDRNRLDPGRVRIKAEFAPYEPVGEPQVEREDHGRYARLRWSVTLRCLDVPCLTGEVSPGITPAGELPASRRAERIFRFPPAHVYYDEPGQERARHLKRVFWPRLEALTRISPRDPSLTFFFSSPFRTTLTPLPELSYSLSPTPLGAALLVGAVLLLLLPASLAVGWWRRRRPALIVEQAPELTPLERALRLVEQTRASRDGEDRRKALEVLAFELESTGTDELAWRARRLAWSPQPPTADAAAELADSVRQADAR